MSRRLVVRRPAETDTNKAVIWYEQQQLGLGREFVAEVRATLRTIAERPESFPIDYKHARRARIDRFPYKIYFTVEPDAIRVVAVLHASQHTRRLRDRL